MECRAADPGPPNVRTHLATRGTSTGRPSGTRLSPFGLGRDDKGGLIPAHFGGFLRRIASLIPARKSCRMMASSSLDEGASTGDGQLMERGAAPATCLSCETAGDVRCRFGRILRRGRRSERLGEPRQVSAHRHYERSPQDGLRAGRRAEGESRRFGEAGYGQSAPCPTPPPRTGSAEVEVEKRRGGRSDGRRK
jgi:hypothetical protein